MGLLGKMKAFLWKVFVCNAHAPKVSLLTLVPLDLLTLEQFLDNYKDGCHFWVPGLINYLGLNIYSNDFVIKFTKTQSPKNEFINPGTSPLGSRVNKFWDMAGLYFFCDHFPRLINYPPLLPPTPP